jgi:hypothetical protein
MQSNRKRSLETETYLVMDFIGMVSSAGRILVSLRPNNEGYMPED